MSRCDCDVCELSRVAAFAQDRRDRHAFMELRRDLAATVVFARGEIETVSRAIEALRRFQDHCNDPAAMRETTAGMEELRGTRLKLRTRLFDAKALYRTHFSEV